MEIEGCRLKFAFLLVVVSNRLCLPVGSGGGELEASTTPPCPDPLGGGVCGRAFASKKKEIGAGAAVCLRACSSRASNIKYRKSNIKYRNSLYYVQVEHQI